MMPNPAQVRARIRAELRYMWRWDAAVWRPDRDEHDGLLDTGQTIGRVAGYPYNKSTRQTSIVIALPGQLDEDDATANHLMVLWAAREDRELTPCEYDPPDAQKDDVLIMATGARYRITSVQTVLLGAYQVYRVREV